MCGIDLLYHSSIPSWTAGAPADIKLLEKEIYGEPEAEDLRDAINSIVDSNNSPLASNLLNSWVEQGSKLLLRKMKMPKST